MGKPSRAEPTEFGQHPLFLRSLNPMFIVDEERRYRDANIAACLFLRSPREEVLKLSIDDLAAPEMRPDLDAIWSDFLEGGGTRQPGQTVPWNLHMPDGSVVPVDLSSTPHVHPGHHLAIVLFPAQRALNERLDRAQSPKNDVLTKREREVLTLVALGNTGVQIAAELGLSPATVTTYVTNALVKLGARNRAHGIAIALRVGALDPVDGAPTAPLLIKSRARRA